MHLRSPSPRTLAVTSLLVLGALAVVLATAPSGEAKGKGGKKGDGLANASRFLPPKGKLFTGTSDTGQTSDYREFRERTGAHPAVMQSFESWGYVPKEALGRWLDTNTRGMLSLSTARCWRCPDVISPQSIAEGKYPNIAGVNSLYKQFNKRPFMIGEWSSWDVDEPRFVRDLFGWIEDHSRARMSVYYQGFGEGADNPYELTDYPRSTEKLRHILNAKKYAPFAPEHVK